VILHVLHCCLLFFNLRDHNIGRLPLKVKKPFFIAKHQQQFGLIIKARDASTANVTNIACSFSITFGKEEVCRKRTATSNVKYFESFHTDNHLSHLQGHHPLKWEEYQRILTNNDKEGLFTRVDAWLSGPIFWSQPSFQHTPVSCKLSSIQSTKAMVMEFWAHIPNFNTL